MYPWGYRDKNQQKTLKKYHREDKTKTFRKIK